MWIVLDKDSKTILFGSDLLTLARFCAHCCDITMFMIIENWSLCAHCLEQPNSASQSRRTERGLEGILYGGFLWYFRNCTSKPVERPWTMRPTVLWIVLLGSVHNPTKANAKMEKINKTSKKKSKKTFQISKKSFDFAYASLGVNRPQTVADPGFSEGAR